jgi:D-3-phosphoglycerate dehydrogenase
MADPVDALVLDLLEWIGDRPRRYAEVMEAWRTSCPRLPVWEEANTRGFLTQEHRPGAGTLISVSAQGRRYLDECRKHGNTPPKPG